MARRRYSEEALRLQPFMAHTGGDVAVIKMLEGIASLQGSIIPDLSDIRDLGSSDKLFRKIWASELDAVIFAQNTQTLVGGWLVIGKGEGKLSADVAAVDVKIDFGQAMTNGDFVLFRAAGQVEYMTIGAVVSGTIYDVTRNLDGSGANAWPAGSIYLILGHDGNGRIILNAIDTPRLQILRQGSAYNLATEMVRLGDMNGAFDFTAEEYGFGVGDYANGNFLRYGPSKGFMLKGGNGNVNIDADGVSIVSDIAVTPSDQNSLRMITPSGNTILQIGTTYSPPGSYDTHASINALPALAEGGAESQLLINADAFTDATAATRATIVQTASANDVTDGSDNIWSALYMNANTGSDGLATLSLEVHARKDATHLVDHSFGLDYIGAKIDTYYIHSYDGWAPAGEVWTYASAATFTVPGNVVTKYPVGTRIKLTQTTAKYFYVTGASYSSPNTTITVTGGSDYTLANAAISENYLSYMAMARGFPEWFNWAPTPTGYSSVPTNCVYRFRIIGRSLRFEVREGTAGTSNATSLTIPLPVTARTITNMTWVFPTALEDNTAVLTTWGRARVGSGESSLTFGINPAVDGGFTNSGGKRVPSCIGEYEI